MNYRTMNPENALAQFDQLFNYAEHVDRFDAVDNIMPKTYMQDVFPRLKPPANVGLFYEVKADLTEEEVQIISRAHVRWVQPGVEALNTSTLQLMKKGTSVFQNLRLLKNCIAYDVNPGWNLLIGFPGEHEEVYKKYLKDIPLLTHLTPPTDVFPVRFDRYSPYFMKAQEYGLDLVPMDYYAFIYPFANAYRTHHLSKVITDEFGQKMSKSMRNTVEVDDIIQQFGTPALRLYLLSRLDDTKDYLSVDPVEIATLSKQLEAMKCNGSTEPSSAPHVSVEEINEDLNRIEKSLSERDVGSAARLVSSWVSSFSRWPPLPDDVRRRVRDISEVFLTEPFMI